MHRYMIGFIILICFFEHSVCKNKTVWFQHTGLIELSDGAMYDGDYFRNIVTHEIKRHGNGVLTLSDGSKSEGHWKWDNLEGNARITSEFGNVFDATFLDGKPNGFGTMFIKHPDSIVCPDEYRHFLEQGSVQQALYVNGKTLGFSLHQHQDGKTRYQWRGTGISIKELYVKEWGVRMIEDCNDYKVLEHMNNTYKGQYYKVANRLYANGTGMVVLSNKNMYHGEWKNGKPNGQGVLIREDGLVFDGEFKNDKFTDNINYAGNWYNEQIDHKKEEMMVDCRMKLDSMMPI